MSEKFRPKFNSEGIPVPNFMQVPDHIVKEVNDALRKRMDAMPQYEEEDDVQEETNS